MPDDLDPAGPGVSLSADLSIVLGGIRSELARANDQRQRLGEIAGHLPVQFTAATAGIVPTPAGTLIIDLGGPQMGRFWEVRGLAVTDAGNVRNAIAGSTFADWYVGKAPASTATPASTAAWKWTQNALPSVSTFSSDQLPITPQDHLFVVITGAATAGQQLLALAQVIDYEAASYRPVMTI